MPVSGSFRTSFLGSLLDRNGPAESWEKRETSAAQKRLSSRFSAQKRRRFCFFVSRAPRLLFREHVITRKIYETFLFRDSNPLRRA